MAAKRRGEIMIGTPEDGFDYALLEGDVKAADKILKLLHESHKEEMTLNITVDSGDAMLASGPREHIIIVLTDLREQWSK